MKTAVLYICTGKYAIFWEQFYNSAEKHLLVNHEKHYFVFTDSADIHPSDRIHKIMQKSRGFPMDSLLRFEMFLGIKKELSGFDYIYFFNSNIRFLSDIGEEILPGSHQAGLTGFLHPGYYNKSPFWYPYERRRRSSAYIPPDYKKCRYFMGAANGGRAAAYLKLIETCGHNVQTDMQQGLIAIYHDESHLNRYFVDKQVLELSPAYLYPEGSGIPFEAKILILDKVLHGGRYFDKLPKRAYYRRLTLFLHRFFNGLFWYIRRLG